MTTAKSRRKNRKSKYLAGDARGGANKRTPRVSMPAEPWDMGAAGPANREGLTIEPATDFDHRTGKDIPNPNGVKRARRVDMLEVWHKRGCISTDGFNAAEKLRDAFEATQRAPGWPDNDRVQASPKPDHAVTIHIDRISRFHEVNRLVVPADREIIGACVLSRRTPAAAGYRNARYPEGLRHLRAALDRLAAAIQRRTR